MDLPSDPSQEDPSGLDPSMALTKKGSKTPLVIVGVLLVGGGGAAAFMANKQHNERKVHAAFMESFADVERNDVGKFWVCILGPGVDVGMFPDNLALSQRIGGAFAT